MAIQHPAMRDVTADWLWILDGCEVTAADLGTLKTHLAFLCRFDQLTGSNGERILDMAAGHTASKLN